MIDYAKLEESCLDVVDNKIALKKLHCYYYQVQMQVAVTGYSWCDFFYARQKTPFSRKYIFDKSFWLVNKCKLEMFYSKVVVKELLRANFNTIKI